MLKIGSVISDKVCILYAWGSGFSSSRQKSVEWFILCFPFIILHVVKVIITGACPCSLTDSRSHLGHYNMDLWLSLYYNGKLTEVLESSNDLEEGSGLQVEEGYTYSLNISPKAVYPKSDSSKKYRRIKRVFSFTLSWKELRE